MPKISEFFGIAILMYWHDQKKHKMPHFHAILGGKEAVFDLKGHLIDGTLGTRGNRLVFEWAKERESQLRKAWHQAVNGKELPWITPLE